MLYVNTGLNPRRILQPHAEPSLAAPVWIDLLSPTDEERSAAERMTGLRVPAEADLAEIESSSRLASEGRTLYLSTPMSYRSADGAVDDRPARLRIIAGSPDDGAFRRAADLRPVCPSAFVGSASRSCSVAAFLGLLEAIVDRLADVLEHVGADLDAISRRVFRPERGSRPNSSQMDLQLRAHSAGRRQRRGAGIKHSRQPARGEPYCAVHQRSRRADWIPVDLRPRFKTLRRDVASLSDYDIQLTNKVQFLLDATLGFINIEQNNSIKILTIVSVVGVPPTLMASIYGMNYKNMPELQWEYGYAYGLAVIVLSGILPFLWFKRRGWI